MRPHKLALVAAALLSIAACARFRAAWGLLTSAEVTPRAVIVAGNTFDALEATATNYLRLPPCPATAAHPVCRETSAVEAIVGAVRSGRVARNTLETLVETNKDAPIPIATYNTLTASVSALRSIFSEYGVK